MYEQQQLAIINLQPAAVTSMIRSAQYVSQIVTVSQTTNCNKNDILWLEGIGPFKVTWVCL